MKELERSIEKNISIIKSGEALSEGELIVWLKDVYNLLDYDKGKSYNLSLASICYIADSNPSSPVVQALLNETIIKSRIFLYRDMLNKKNNDFIENNQLGLVGEFTKLFYTDLKTGSVLTKSQKEILSLFNNKKRLVLSAPTSFGKTKILEEIILNNQYKRIAIVVPTNALLSENYHRLRENPLILSQYTIISSSKINPALGLTENTIFILTPEKLLNLLDERVIEFDFFVFDEFYKISKEFETLENGDYDKRYKVFQYALYTLLQNKSVDFYMIGPYIDNLSKNFLEKEKAIFKEYDIEIVQKEIFSDKEKINLNLGLKLLKDKKTNTYRILDKLRERRQQSLIYVPRQNVAEILAKSYASYLDNFEMDNPNEERLTGFIDYIKENISPEWDLIPALKKGIAFHHGGIPRYIQTEIVSLFNKSIIHSLICTTTLAEGVNTTTKNVVIYEAKKAKSPLTTFDRKNIEGRSGRFGEHFVGNVFYLVKPNDEENETDVEFELYDSNNLSQEDIILLNDKDLSATNLKNKETLLSKLNEYKIPETLVRKNRFINIDKQIGLVRLLRSSESLPFEDKSSNNFILDIQLLDQLFENIFKLVNTDARGKWNGYTYKQLSWLAGDYIRKPYLRTIISHEIIMGNSKNINTRIRNALKILSQHFEFLLPRYIQVFQEIYNFVAKERGGKELELGYIINLLEYGTSNEVEVLLRDAGLPLEIVRKVKAFFDNCEDANAIIARKRERYEDLKKVLNRFEMQLLDRYL